MAIQVHTPIKPAVPHRALLTAMALLALCTAGALMMSWRRSHQGPVLGGAEFGATFRPPTRIRRGERGSTGQGPAFLFELVSDRGETATLMIRRLRTPNGEDAREICLNVLTADRRKRTFLREPAFEWIEAPMGRITGVELRDLQSHAVARCVVLSRGVAFVASLVVFDSALDEGLYDQFDRTCRSFEFQDP